MIAVAQQCPYTGAGICYDSNGCDHRCLVLGTRHTLPPKERVSLWTVPSIAGIHRQTPSICLSTSIPAQGEDNTFSMQAPSSRQRCYWACSTRVAFYKCELGSEQEQQAETQREQVADRTSSMPVIAGAPSPNLSWISFAMCICFAPAPIPDHQLPYPGSTVRVFQSIIRDGVYPRSSQHPARWLGHY